ncbi:hypothetical protein C923_04900 [Plasmodium falciparum UGT5.1]|uniref:Uncharacterized protein n=3 Tax=Plasmodium falciparum TaxID=5833 RepID=W4J211_PLAFP|nr:hypothetical protein PFUGPA_02444 [Plasmodium falciparum Palo Alto/Uganda]ETW59289.1 hypothetical protein PFMC_04766 [Plasmodium falciparum CAMP/Malaysia]EWC74405.1 hypothetical protein C923_04900 [Plasmodium falciparum UGT5.1]
MKTYNSLNNIMGFQGEHNSTVPSYNKSSMEKSSNIRNNRGRVYSFHFLVKIFACSLFIWTLYVSHNGNVSTNVDVVNTTQGLSKGRILTQGDHHEETEDVNLKAHHTGERTSYTEVKHRRSSSNSHVESNTFQNKEETEVNADSAEQQNYDEEPSQKGKDVKKMLKKADNFIETKLVSALHPKKNHLLKLAILAFPIFMEHVSNIFKRRGFKYIGSAMHLVCLVFYVYIFKVIVNHLLTNKEDRFAHMESHGKHAFDDNKSKKKPKDNKRYGSGSHDHEEEVVEA